MLTTQDLVKGIDITGQTNVTGSQLNQLVDAGRTAVDKGLTITTTDTAADTPEVPDPNGDYSGVNPTWWINYLWIRRPFVTETSQRVLCYMWDENVTPDVTLLQWTLIDFNGTAALALATAHTPLITTAQNTANTAQTNAENAQTAADNAQGDVNTLSAQVSTIGETIEALDAELETLWASGDLKHTCRTTVYSTSENQGWLECDGTAVDRTEFADLFAAIGTTWGIGNGTTTFNIPDFRGRTLIGAGTGGGLTARSLGQQSIGAETHLLTGAQSGTSVHSHLAVNSGSIMSYPSDAADATPNIEQEQVGAPATFSGANPTTRDSVAADAASAHPNMQPSAVSRILIKT